MTGAVLDWGLGAVSGPLLANHARLAARRGIGRLTVVVSFDCDTDEDIDVVPEVHGRLTALGITPVYAVPGELLERAASTYAALAGSGAELLNHGYRQHCRIEPGTRTYVSSMFYDELTPQQVADDVRGGHDAHLRVLGRAPVGFRVPHFGTYQRPAQLRHLHGILASLGYRYSSSTTPIHGLLRGPVVKGHHGILELPVSGRRDLPRRVLDTWSFRFAPGRDVEPDDYVAQVRAMLAYFAGGRRPGLLNLYGDPSQVADWDGFFTVCAELAPHAAPSFSSVLDRLGAPS